MDPHVVGGGIGGLTAAIALRQRGFDPVVSERAAELRPVGAGLLLGTNALRVYDRLGLADRIRDAGSEKTAIRLVDPSGATLSSLDVAALEAEFGHPFVAIHRGDLQRLLLDRLPEWTVRTDAECVGVTRRAGGPELSFVDGTTETAGVVVGADGIGSAVRGALFPDAAVRPSGLVCYRGVAPVTLSAAERTTGVEVWARGHVAGFEALDGERTYWYVTATRPLADPEDPDALSRALEATVESYPAPLPDLVAATPGEAVLVDELADVGALPTWSRGSVGLLGDAAHAPLPFLGQGAGQAVEDAVAIARTLDERDDVRAAFDAYEAARKEKADRVVAASRRLGQAARLEGTLTCKARNVAMRWLPDRIARNQQRAIARLSL